MFELTEESFILFAIKNYDNPGCTGLSEFYNDIKRFKYLKRLLKRCHKPEDIKERLIINHIVVLCNLFGPVACTRMLLFKTEKEFYPYLLPFLLYLNLVQESSIAENLNAEIIEKLRKL